MTLRANPLTGGGSAWRSWEELGERAPDGHLAEWLRHSGSMTAALRAQCAGQFDLRVHLEAAASFSTHQVGELRAQRGLLREVVMSCDGVPWVFAQTLIPKATLDANDWLAHMGEQPLGDALFQRGDVTRSPFAYARITPDASLHGRIAHLLVPGEPAPWARRSYFSIGTRRLLINEVFLPGLASCPVS